MTFVAGALISPESGSIPFHDIAEVSTVAGTPVTVLSFTVPVAKTRKLRAIGGSCPMTGVFELKEGANLVAKGRTSPADPNWYHSFSPQRPFAAGQTLTLTFCARANSPVQDVDGFAMALDFG